MGINVLTILSCFVELAALTYSYYYYCDVEIVHLTDVEDSGSRYIEMYLHRKFYDSIDTLKVGAISPKLIFNEYTTYCTLLYF